jgi:hypothetical protein
MRTWQHPVIGRNAAAHLAVAGRCRRFRAFAALTGKSIKERREMMRSSVRGLLFAAAALAASVPAVTVPGLAAEEKPKSEALENLQRDIPDQKLDAAAAAMQQVASMRETYQQRFDTAPPSDKERIANEASMALTKAVTDKGLSVDEYSAILTMAQNDPTVRERIMARMRTQPKE